jgi:hypothetical protein
MFRKTPLAMALVAIAAGTACSDAIMSPSTAGTASTLSSGNSAATPVTASALATFQTQGSTNWISITGQPSNHSAEWWCEAGVLYKQHHTGVSLAGKDGLWDQKGVIPHPQCQTAEVVAAQTITITFTMTGTVARARSGNINLNFLESCLDDECSKPSVQYHSKSNMTAGFGTHYAIASGSDGSSWMLDLSSFSATGSNWFDTKTITPITVDEVGGAGRTSTATLTFVLLTPTP